MPELGFAEIIVIVVVCLLLFGPDRIPEIARNIGKARREVTKWQTDLRREIETIVDLDETKRLLNGTSVDDGKPATAPQLPAAPQNEPRTAANEPVEGPRSVDPYA